MERQEIMSNIDIIIRDLSHPNSSQERKSEQSHILNEVDKEDEMKLLNLLEEMVVLLKDDPENKGRVRTIWDGLMNRYGHIAQISQILKSVEKSYL
jgi:hypothetical protein